jgi:ribosomal protein L24
MTDLKEGTRVKVTSGEYVGHSGVIVKAWTYTSGANTDYDVILDDFKDPQYSDGSVMVEDFELEAE